MQKAARCICSHISEFYPLWVMGCAGIWTPHLCGWGWVTPPGYSGALIPPTKRHNCHCTKPVCNKGWSKSPGRVESTPMDSETGRVGKPGRQAARAHSAARAQTQFTHTPCTRWSAQTWSAQTRTGWWTPRTELDEKGKKCEQELCGEVLGLHAGEVCPGIQV